MGGLFRKPEGRYITTPMQDLGTTFLASAERSPTARALVDGDIRLDFEAWRDEVLRLVAGLDGLGLAKGERIVVALQNRREMASLHWACQLAGLVITPVNWRAKAGELDFYLENAEASALVFEPVTSDAAAGSARARDLPRISVGGAAGGTAIFETLLDEAPADPIPRAAADDLSLMFYTSGTTGRPKGVPRTHRMERAAALAHIAQNQYAERECTLGVMPLYHTMGVRSLLAMALLDGAFVCLPAFEPEQALSLIERERVSNLYLVPTLFHSVLETAGFTSARVQSVSKLGFAGAAMTDDLLFRANDAFEPDLFVNHYGSSEIYTFTVCPDAVAKPGSAGKAGLNQQIRIARLGAAGPDDLADDGEEGEIIARLGNDEAFTGYWRRPDADEKSLREGWYFTGDTGYRDDEGDVFVTGRVDDMIITGGENVSPAEIESVLSLHDAVAEVAVVGLPDERWGQKVTAFVKRNGGATAAALDAHCQASDLANFKRPRDYIFVANIPKSPVGKLLRRLLKSGDYVEDKA